MARFLNNPHDPLLPGPTRFSGANMISRSFETAVIQGIPGMENAEDQKFGQHLSEYAALHGKTVVGAKETLIMTTTSRESDRTPASFKQVFDTIHPDIPEIVPDLMGTGSTDLTEGYTARLKRYVRTRPGGDAFVDRWEALMPKNLSLPEDVT